MTSFVMISVSLDSLIISFAALSTNYRALLLLLLLLLLYQYFHFLLILSQFRKIMI